LQQNKDYRKTKYDKRMNRGPTREKKEMSFRLHAHNPKEYAGRCAGSIADSPEEGPPIKIINSYPLKPFYKIFYRVVRSVQEYELQKGQGRET
jgi:hypothetical protein